MRTKFIGFILLIFIGQNGFTQVDFDSRVTRKTVDCEDISYNSSLLFIDYVKSEQLDSAKILLEYWESKCEMREPLFRAKILLSIIMDEFSEDLYDSTVLDYAYIYEVRTTYRGTNNSEYYEMYKPYFGYIKWDSEFDEFTIELASRMRLILTADRLERYFCELYSDNFNDFYRGISDYEFSDTKIYSNYFNKTEKLLKLPDSYTCGFVGTRIPANKLKDLGTHPEIGFSTGLKGQKLAGSLALGFSFLRTPNEYTVYKKNNDTIQSDFYLGVYIGLDFQYDIIQFGNSDFYIASGIGWDGFDTEFDWNESNISTTSSYNLNVGLGYRYYLRNDLFIGIEYKYNIVDYSLNHVTDFTGNYHGVKFIIGILENDSKYKKFDDLHYFDN